MERIIFSMLLAFGLYQIDWVNNPDYIWILAYIVFGILYLRQMKKIDVLFGIKKTFLEKTNNFLLHISFVILLLIVIYGVSGASLGEGGLLGYSIIEYPMFLVFLFPLFLGLQIFLTRAYFKGYKNTNPLTAIYLLYPTYFRNSKKELSTNTFIESEFKINKFSLLVVFFTAITIILLVCSHFLQLIIFHLSLL